jgi:hypothetical protein
MKTLKRIAEALEAIAGALWNIYRLLQEQGVK